MADKKTPNQRLNELRQAAAEKRDMLRQNQAVSPEEMEQSVTVLLSLRALETGALNENSTVAAIDRTWQKNTEFFHRQAQGFMERTGPEKLRQLVLPADGGKELTNTFTRYIQTLDRIPEDMPPHLMGSAGYRIRQLKERMNRGEFDAPERKRMALAEIAAARESVEAENDTIFIYDWRLAHIMKPDVSVNARQIERELEQIPDEQIDRVFAKAKGRGYGQSVMDALDKRRTPVQKEIRSVQKFGYSLNRDHVAEAAAQLEAAYKKAMQGEDRLEYWQNADPVMYPTAREQIEALQRRLKTDERLNSSVRTRNALSLILAAREMLHVRRGIRGGDERLDQTMNAGIFARADEIYETLGTLPAEQLKALREKAREGHGGALEEDYHAILRKKAAAEEQVRGNANRDQLPTAKERIEALQARLRTTQDPAEKLRCVVGIIAARQTVGAQRGGMFGGDKRLNDTLDPAKLAEREQDVALYMSNLPEKVQNALAAQAEEGHGVAMMETYREANTVKTQMDGLRTRALGGEPVDMARAIALAIVKKGDKDSPEPLDEDAVRKNMLLTRKMSGYEAFAGDPKALDLLKSGNFPRLVVNYRDHVAKAQENQFAEQVREQGKREGPQEAENDLEHQLQ